MPHFIASKSRAGHSDGYTGIGSVAAWTSVSVSAGSNGTLWTTPSAAALSAVSSNSAPLRPGPRRPRSRHRAQNLTIRTPASSRLWLCGRVSQGHNTTAAVIDLLQRAPCFHTAPDALGGKPLRVGHTSSSTAARTRVALYTVLTDRRSSTGACHAPRPAQGFFRSIA